MPRTPSPPLGLTLMLLRSARGWSQKELAEAAGLSRGLLSEYETGATELTRERLVELAGSLGWPPDAVDVALFALGMLRFAPSEPGSPVDPDEEQRRIVDRAAAVAAQEAASEVRAQLTREIREDNARQARQAAEILWKRLKPFSAADRRVLVSGAREYQDPFLCERLCAESERAAASNAARARELAELALLVAERVPGSATWRSRLQGYAWAFAANAHRVANDMPVADAAFANAWKFWRQGPADGPDLFDEARVLDLEASLRRAQRRFGEALDLHERAWAVAKPEAVGYILINKAKLQEDLEDYEGALASLERAETFIEEKQEPRLAFVLRFNRAVNLLYQERLREAEALLAEARERAVELGNELDLVRVLWLEARIAAGEGRAGEAMELFDHVRREFAAREMAYDFALVSLELSVLWLENEHPHQVRALAEHMVWIFKTQGIHREALAAIQLFCEAAKKEDLTAAQVRRLVAYLTKARHTPELRFEL